MNESQTSHIFTHEDLRKLTRAILVQAGTPRDIADEVASVLVENQLAGHDSHGLLRIPSYLRWIEEGLIVPDARPQIIDDNGATATVRGHQGFGQTTARIASDLATEKALSHGVSAVSVVDVAHTGRLGAFTERAAKQGVVMFMAVGSGGPPSTVPFGGAAPTLGTNPIAFSVPRRDGSPVTLDYATSAIANGKLLLAASRNESVPPGNIVDSTGAPTTDPNDYFDGGALLPFGGHKGYALAVIAELLAGPLTGSDDYDAGIMDTGIFIFAVSTSAFRPEDSFFDAVERTTSRIVSVPPAPNSNGVRLPGEPEAQTRSEREIHGISIPNSTWDELKQAAAVFGLDAEKLVKMPVQK